MKTYRLLLIIVVLFYMFPAFTEAAEDLETTAGGSTIYIAKVQLPELLSKQKIFNSDRIVDAMAEALTSASGFEVRAESDLKQVMKKKEYAQMMGFDDMLYDTALAKSSESDLLFRSSINKVGGQFRLAASLINYSEGRLISRSSVTFNYPQQAYNSSELLVYRVMGLEDKLKKPSPPRQSSSDGTIVQEAIPENEIEADPADDPSETKDEVKEASVRGLIMVRYMEGELIDAKGGEALERRLALRLAKENKLAVVAQSELRDMLMQEERKQLLTSADSMSLSKIAAKLDARYLAVISIGKVGEKIIVSGSLIDAKEQAGVARSSIMLPNASQLTEGAEVVALALIGIDIPLPKPVPEPNRFQKAMVKLEKSVSISYEPYLDNALSQLSILPFDNYGSESRVRKLGEASASYLSDQLHAIHALPVVPKSRLDELKDKQELSGIYDMPIEELREIGRFLGASVIVVGRITELANDFMISVRLIDTGLGQTVGVGHTFFPMGDRGTLMKKAFVVKTKAGAIYRSLIPGWGQFYNGPKHYWKGGLVVSGFLAGVAAGTTLIILSNQKRAETGVWDRGGTEFPKYCTNEDSSFCMNKINGIESSANNLLYGSIAAFSTAGVVWIIGIIDAAVEGEDYSDEIYGSASF